MEIEPMKFGSMAYLDRELVCNGLTVIVGLPRDIKRIEYSIGAYRSVTKARKKGNRYIFDRLTTFEFWPEQKKSKCEIVVRAKREVDHLRQEKRRFRYFAGTDTTFLSAIRSIGNYVGVLDKIQFYRAVDGRLLELDKEDVSEIYEDDLESLDLIDSYSGIGASWEE